MMKIWLLRSYLENLDDTSKFGNESGPERKVFGSLFDGL